ncbi:MAG: hypothetical protein M3R04_08945 [bacterium]|nr:hypothetical protein [bacterium]
MELILPRWRRVFGNWFFGIWILFVMSTSWWQPDPDDWPPFVPDFFTLGAMVGLLVIHPFGAKEHLSPFARKHLWVPYALWITTFVCALGLWVGAPLYRSGVTQLWGMNVTVPLWDDMIPIPLLMWFVAIPLAVCYAGMLWTKAEAEGRDPWDEYRDLWKEIRLASKRKKAG